MKPPFKFAWELVTPAIAAAWLKKNTKNRNMRTTTVNAFAADMKRGAWSPTHQGIAFSTTGELIDGQHRLAAIVHSGCSIAFLICRDVPKRVTGVKADVMDAIDRGNARSIADVLKLAHGLKVDAHMIAAACAMIARIAIVKQRDQRMKKITLAQTLEILALYKDDLKFVSENRPVALGLRSAPACAAVAFAHAVEPAKTEEFYRKFATGIGIDADSPVLAIRNHFLSANLGRGSLAARSHLSEVVLHGIYCYIKREPLPRLPKEGGKTHADWFRAQQAKTIQALEDIFPAPSSGPVISAATWKPNAAVDELLRGREMSERVNRKAARQESAQ